MSNSIFMVISAAVVVNSINQARWPWEPMLTTLGLMFMLWFMHPKEAADACDDDSAASSQSNG